MAKEKVVTQRIAGPVDIGGTRFPLAGSMTLEFVQGVHRLVFEGESFFVVLYGALNVHGLIGTEHNGIAVLWENRGRPIFTDHFKDSSYMKASDRQRREYEVICGMDQAQFKAFINEHPKALYKVFIPKPEPILRPKLRKLPFSFLATQYSSVADKEMFFKSLLKFLSGHCDRDRFTRLLYDGLHQHLGHIAHYNIDGFYATWFADVASRVKFLEYHVQYPVHGGWRDVGDALTSWIMSPEGQAVVAYYKREAEHGSKETVGY